MIIEFKRELNFHIGLSYITWFKLHNIKLPEKDRAKTQFFR